MEDAQRAEDEMALQAATEYVQSQSSEGEGEMDTGLQPPDTTGIMAPEGADFTLLPGELEATTDGTHPPQAPVT